MLASRLGVSSLGIKMPERHPRQLVVSLPLPRPHTHILSGPLHLLFHLLACASPRVLSGSLLTACRSQLKCHLLREAWPGLLSAHQLYFALHNFAFLGSAFLYLSDIRLPAGTDHELHEAPQPQPHSWSLGWSLAYSWHSVRISGMTNACPSLPPHVHPLFPPTSSPAPTLPAST